MSGPVIGDDGVPRCPWGSSPGVMRAYHDHTHGGLSQDALVEVLESVQSLLLRRTVVGLSNDRLVARLCRAREDGPEALVRAIARITPSDERVKVGLKFSELPHAAYVLGRLAGVTTDAASAPLDLEHVVPLAPADTWSGDGVRPWAEYTDDEQNSHRALAQTLGNLTLLERPLAERAFDESYPAKRELYAQSAVSITRDLAEVPSWGTAAIAARRCG